MKTKKEIFVTQPLLPPLEEFVPYLEKIWDNKILTNGGMFHEQLEKALCDYLKVEHIALFTNGTIALVHLSLNADVTVLLNHVTLLKIIPTNLDIKEER